MITVAQDERRAQRNPQQLAVRCAHRVCLRLIIEIGDRSNYRSAVVTRGLDLEDPDGNVRFKPLGVKTEATVVSLRSLASRSSSPPPKPARRQSGRLAGPNVLHQIRLCSGVLLGGL